MIPRRYVLALPLLPLVTAEMSEVCLVGSNELAGYYMNACARSLVIPSLIDGSPARVTCMSSTGIGKGRSEIRVRFEEAR